jgi:uncharacterized membrane protein
MGDTARNFFSEKQKQQITQAIKTAELGTSGEIRVHIENMCEGDVLDRAATVFEKLGMTKTALRNGVLFYLAVKSHHFAILGDVAINAHVPAGFWETVKVRMMDYFSRGEFAEGLSEGILMAGEELKKHFPVQTDDVNELSDDISFGSR